MKKIISVCFCLFIFLGVQAQKTVPVIKVGSIMNATASMSGTDFPVSFTVIGLEKPTSIGWSVEGYGDGSFEMTAKGLESGTELYLAQPSTGKATLKDNQTFLIISKGAFKSILDNKSFTYNNIKFNVTSSDEVVKINDKETDAIHLTMDGGKGEIWVLNNSNFPLLIKTKGLLTDVVIDTIK